jgi:hypothetical protein
VKTLEAQLANMVRGSSIPKNGDLIPNQDKLVATLRAEIARLAASPPTTRRVAMESEVMSWEQALTMVQPGSEVSRSRSASMGSHSMESDLVKGKKEKKKEKAALHGSKMQVSDRDRDKISRSELPQIPIPTTTTTDEKRGTT